MSYPQNRQVFTDLLLSTFKNYPSAFVLLLPYSLLLGVISCLYFYVGYLPQEKWFKLIASFIIVLLQVYVWSAALIAMDDRFTNQKSRINEIFNETWSRAGQIFAGFFLTILICSATFYIGYVIVLAITWAVPENHGLYAILIMLFVSLPIMVIAVYTLLLVPQLAVRRIAVFAALKNCFKQVGLRNWLVTFILYCYVLVILFLTYPDTQHMHWLREHFLALPFNFVVYAILLPFVVSYALLLINRISLK